MSPREVSAPALATDEGDLRLGSLWLGRVGAALAITGLVAFANHAVVSGEPRRVLTLALSYAVSAIAIWLGLRLGRKHAGAHAPALAAGGLAGVYYTTYAAHQIAAVQVIRSPVAAAVLLLVCAGVVIWVAHRDRSPDTALLALVLAFYAGLIGPATSFTLLSNAILAGAAFVFLVRNAWSALPLGLMAATYLTFGSWLLYRNGWLVFPLYLGVPDFWRAAGAVFAYWTVFTTPLMLSADPGFTERRRGAVLALNSGFAWALIGLMLPRSDPLAFAKAFGAFGLVLLVFAVPIARRNLLFVLSSHTARTEGLVLVAVAVATVWTGPGAALVVALVALALAMAAQYADSHLLRAATVLVSLMAAALACAGARESGLPAVTVGAVLLFTAWWVERDDLSSPRLNLGTVYFIALGEVVWLMATLFRAPAAERPTALALEAVALTAAAHLVGLVPAAFLAQAFLVVAHGTFLRRADAFAGPGLSAWQVVAVTLALSAWWRARPDARLLGPARRFFTTWYAAAAVAVVFVWLRWRLPPESAGAWLVVPAILAVLALGYAVLSGDWALGVLGQAYLIVSLAEFWLRWEEMPPPGGLVMLAPLAALVVVAAIVDHWRAREVPLASGPAWAGRVSAFARMLATLLVAVWVYWYVSPQGQFLALELMAVLLLAWAGDRKDPVGFAASAVLSTGGLLLFWMSRGGSGGFSFADLFAFVLLLAQQQLWRRRYADLVPAEMHDPSMVMGVLSLWRWVHLGVISEFGAPWLAAGSAVAGAVVCGLGLWLREGRYRQLGSVILLGALVRLAVLDRAGMPTLPWLVSVLVLGAILLVLGFLYDGYRGHPAQRA